MADITTLVSDVEALVQESYGSPRAVNVTALSLMGKNSAMHVADMISKPIKVRPEKTLYASELGKCPRALWYDLHGTHATEPISGKALIKFSYGDIVEEMFLYLAEEAGHKVELRQFGVETVLDNGWTVKGRIDAAIDGVIVDVKSAGSRAYQKFTGGYLDNKDDSFGYNYQLGFYTEVMNPPVGSMYWAVNKETADSTLCVPDDVEALNQAKYISEQLELREEGSLELSYSGFSCHEIPKGLTSSRVIPVQCSYCQHQKHCYRNFNNEHGLVIAKHPKYNTYKRFSFWNTDAGDAGWTAIGNTNGK